MQVYYLYNIRHNIVKYLVIYWYHCHTISATHCQSRKLVDSKCLRIMPIDGLM